MKGAEKMGTEEFNSIQFEKRLNGLKDSQDSINVCCHWCLENRDHHKKIVTTWLNVLKRVKVEQRLTLFYLANDVIQYSKRKNYDFVESWGTALQKATTMVRDEKVKHKILRIFKIWEQRGIYSDEFLGDLAGLISVSPANKKLEDCSDFQPSYLITRIRNCAKLETDTDLKLKMFKQHNPKLMDGEALVSSLKDRAHVDDVEKEMEDYVNHMEQYVNALKLEIKARTNLINMLLNAESQLEKDRKDVKVVTLAYKSFATRVKNLKKKLDEKKETLNSPVPSPDVDAPSPASDSDIELPDGDSTKNFAYTNAGFYTPVSSTSESYTNNGFSSFMGSNMPFNMQNLTSTVFGQTDSTNASYTPTIANNLFSTGSQPPPPPAPVPPVTTGYQYNNAPLVPPPLPPFTKSEYGSDNYGDFTQNNYGSYGSQSGDYYNPAAPYDYTPNTNFDSSAAQPVISEPDPSFQAYDPYNLDEYNPDEYNPEEELEKWDTDEQWDQPPQDTPASPPPFDKQSFAEPIEYHDGQSITGAVDVDHRILNPKLAGKKKDVDHRNLISLTGSPKENEPVWKSSGDQDYRNLNTLVDTDYRKQPFKTNIPAPPVPPSLHADKPQEKPKKNSPRKFVDNVESIDMELSDEDENEKVKSDEKKCKEDILPPPPFPNDADANNFLDSLNEELNEETPSWSEEDASSASTTAKTTKWNGKEGERSNWRDPEWNETWGNETNNWNESEVPAWNETESNWNENESGWKNETGKDNNWKNEGGIETYKPETSWNENWTENQSFDGEPLQPRGLLGDYPTFNKNNWTDTERSFRGNRGGPGPNRGAFFGIRGEFNGEFRGRPRGGFRGNNKFRDARDIRDNIHGGGKFIRGSRPRGFHPRSNRGFRGFNNNY